MGITTKRSAMSMRRGRGSGLKRELDDSGSSSSFTGGMGSSSTGTNWLNTKKSVKELPTEEGEVKLIETGAFLLVNKQTNPGGAASTVKYDGETYCFEANCPQCKVPMSKAKVLPPNEETDGKAPRVSCDLCKSTYNLKTGEKLEAAESTGLFGGLAKAVLSSQDTGNLDTYQLGEKNGKIMFTMEGM
eukprot:CAMPEP_0201123412 /NCGR_PEP_ID=MMETSP0850-20130426/6775_1 /ASSEMBLY_ACC=CAM_ASM_000622 /TAXON_ID=183588 /ORGANISM="Pseudo-nitzschia fraudulenta, Strain WWA7" /LENGTH=187 /DNA_ID=CAMNT_0047390303 /DNA_START=221 /DNA_END=784 /DNA_ORIENTATION=-